MDQPSRIILNVQCPFLHTDYYFVVIMDWGSQCPVSVLRNRYIACPCDVILLTSLPNVLTVHVPFHYIVKVHAAYVTRPDSLDGFKQWQCSVLILGYISVSDYCKRCILVLHNLCFSKNHMEYSSYWIRVGHVDFILSPCCSHCVFVCGIWANDYYIAIWLHNLYHMQHPGGLLQYENGKMVQNNHNHNSIQCNMMGFYLFQRFDLWVGLHQGIFQYRIVMIKYMIVFFFLQVCLQLLLWLHFRLSLCLRMGIS